MSTRTSPAGVYPTHTCYCCHLASSALLIYPNYALFLFVGLPAITLLGIRVVSAPICTTFRHSATAFVAVTGPNSCFLGGKRHSVERELKGSCCNPVVVDSAGATSSKCLCLDNIQWSQQYYAVHCKLVKASQILVGYSNESFRRSSTKAMAGKSIFQVLSLKCHH